MRSNSPNSRKQRRQQQMFDVPRRLFSCTITTMALLVIVSYLSVSSTSLFVTALSPTPSQTPSVTSYTNTRSRTRSQHTYSKSYSHSATLSDSNSPEPTAFTNTRSSSFTRSRSSSFTWSASITRTITPPPTPTPTHTLTDSHSATSSSSDSLTPSNTTSFTNVTPTTSFISTPSGTFSPSITWSHSPTFSVTLSNSSSSSATFSPSIPLTSSPTTSTTPTTEQSASHTISNSPTVSLSPTQTGSITSELSGTTSASPSTSMTLSEVISVSNSASQSASESSSFSDSEFPSVSFSDSTTVTASDSHSASPTYTLSPVWPERLSVTVTQAHPFYTTYGVPVFNFSGNQSLIIYPRLHNGADMVPGWYRHPQPPFAITLEGPADVVATSFQCTLSLPCTVTVQPSYDWWVPVLLSVQYDNTFGPYEKLVELVYKQGPTVGLQVFVQDPETEELGPFPEIFVRGIDSDGFLTTYDKHVYVTLTIDTNTTATTSALLTGKYTNPQQLAHAIPATSPSDGLSHTFVVNASTTLPESQTSITWDAINITVVKCPPPRLPVLSLVPADPATGAEAMGYVNFSMPFTMLRNWVPVECLFGPYNA
ncbi:membrane-associated protein, putative, partial [Bodo saltans]